MSNYLDNQGSWSWNVTKDSATITTDHGSHTHTLNLSNISIGDIVSNPGKTLGDAHREATHDYKNDTSNKGDNSMSDFRSGLKVDQATQDALAAVSAKYAAQMNDASASSKRAAGGRERGDEGPGSQGRTPGDKPAPHTTAKGEASLAAKMAASHTAAQAASKGASKGANVSGVNGHGTNGGHNGHGK